ncbi:N-acetyl-D-Glu racemase DgcA [Terasakiella sp. A23]|uniref:N-acetyl-D-Glu racemase DgcA n=1 Tax=Terasakiella sp. FCG-A23 TaxID=3080561 RepID=UPI0029543F8D|nr:N-acetyl-D-Glu racemase DgcA [Terasakiella sp. A23]MDV7338244.1 N-acetyl-D-Glu racemase DgcA [Terasakiella sp. A23]
MSIELKVQHTSWPIAGSFTISRGTKTSAEVVMVELSEDGFTGRGECVPYARYGETVQSVTDQIMELQADLKNGLDRVSLQKIMKAGAARNAVDCAFWDLEAKQAGKRVWDLVGLSDMSNLTTAYTLSLESPEMMGQKAKENAHLPLLKLKLAGPDDLDRVAAVRNGAPNSRIIVDANEGWTAEVYQDLAPKLVELGVEMIEQPLPAGEDEVLRDMVRPVAVCADESCHGLASLADIEGKYDMINIKLDKTGGLTEALLLKEAAEKAGLEIMVGCMLGPSLAMAPAMVVGQGAKVVDLDGPLLLAKDHEAALEFNNGIMTPPNSALWG